MPNSLGHRRVTQTSVSTEVEKLKAELAALRSAYVQDMKNISADISTLSDKVDPTPVVDTEVVS